MIKNLLKYQQGGAAPTQEEQQLIAAFIQWLPKRVKEFQGMQPEEVAKAIDGMTKTTEGKKQVQQLMQQFQQEVQSAQSAQAFRQGGKIHDFICKHAKGGKAECGCGKKVPKAQGGSDGMPQAKNAKAARRAASKNTVSVGNSGRAKNRKIGAATDKFGGQHLYEDSVIDGSWSDVYVDVPHPGDTIVTQRFPIAGGNDVATRTYPMGSEPYESIMSRMRPAFRMFFPQYKCGGEIEKAKNGKKSLGKKFANATIKAAMAEQPSIMTASGWRQDENGNMVQDNVFDPGVKSLRNSLSVISALSPTHPMNVVFNSIPYLFNITGGSLGKGLIGYPFYGTKLALEQPTLPESEKCGGIVEKVQRGGTEPKKGYSSNNEYYSNGDLAGTNEYSDNMSRHTLIEDGEQPWTWMHDNPMYLPGPAGFAVEPESQRGRGPMQETRYVSPEYWKWLNAKMDFASKYGSPDYKKCGGKVEKAQDGVPKIRQPHDQKSYFLDNTPLIVGQEMPVQKDYGPAPYTVRYVFDPKTGKVVGKQYVGESVVPYSTPAFREKYDQARYIYGDKWNVIGTRSKRKDEPYIRESLISEQRCGGKVEKGQKGKGQLGRTYKWNDPNKYAEEGVDPNTLVEWSPVLVAYPDGGGSTVRSSFKDDMNSYYLRLKYNNPDWFTQNEINWNLNNARKISEANRGKGWMYQVRDFSYDPLREYGVHYKQQDLFPNGLPWNWEAGTNTMYTWPWQPKGAADTVLVGYPVERTLGRERVSNREPGFEAARDKWFEMINHPKTVSEWEAPWRFRAEGKLESSKSLKEEREKSKKENK